MELFRAMRKERKDVDLNTGVPQKRGFRKDWKQWQVYFEDERLPILSSWLNSQAQDNMNKVYQMMNRICHDGGCVVINEMKRDTHEWTTPLNALNELLEHEQYISCQVNTFLILCRNVNMSFHSFISGLYADRIYVSTAFMELLRILAKENERKLPYF